MEGSSYLPQRSRGIWGNEEAQVPVNGPDFDQQASGWQSDFFSLCGPQLVHFNLNLMFINRHKELNLHTIYWCERSHIYDEEKLMACFAFQVLSSCAAVNSLKGSPFPLHRGGTRFLHVLAARIQC